MKKPTSMLGVTVVGLVFAGTLFAQQSNTDAVSALGAQAERAAQQAASDTLEPHEINMIEWRRTMMGQPGLQQYVVFMSRSGQPIDYFVTDGKCVSSNKRLQPKKALHRTNWNDVILTEPSADGTHGSSSGYIYCFTVDGKYKQWNGRYYVSSTPIELTIKPLVLDSSATIQAQQ